MCLAGSQDAAGNPARVHLWLGLCGAQQPGSCTHCSMVVALTQRSYDGAAAALSSSHEMDSGLAACMNNSGSFVITHRIWPNLPDMPYSRPITSCKAAVNVLYTAHKNCCAKGVAEINSCCTTLAVGSCDDCGLIPASQLLHLGQGQCNLH